MCQLQVHVAPQRPRAMGKTWDHISAYAKDVISKQHVFFVATAPLSAGGRVNVSPKGHCADTFSIVNDHQVAYLDLTGSGIETVAHVKENGRITFMFCNFDDGPPCIIRLWGRATVHERGTAEFNTWLQQAFSAATAQRAHPGLTQGIRSVIVADIYEVASACGYAVPIMEYKQDRDSLLSWTASRGPDALLEYKQEKNTHSLDGLTGLQSLPGKRGSSTTCRTGCKHSGHASAAAVAPATACTTVWWVQRLERVAAAIELGNITWFGAGIALGVFIKTWPGYGWLRV